MTNTALNLVVPALGESISEATVARWLKKPGDNVVQDETLVELETDKVTLEVNAPASGTLLDIARGEGEVVAVGDLLGQVGAGEVTSIATAATQNPANQESPSQTVLTANDQPSPSPAAKKIIEENKLNPSIIPASGKDGRITKEDVMNFLGSGSSSTTAAPAYDLFSVNTATQQAPVVKSQVAARKSEEREERVKMTRLRKTIATRLKDVQNTAAILTSFNEVDMTRVMDLRSRVKDNFEKKYGTKLGFMSFFVKACIIALKEIPAINAEIDGDDIVYKNYYDIGVAVSTPTGLVVPVVRDADQKSFAEIESDIVNLSARAREGNLSVSDMTGGTFTITNGGVFGSLMSTPIINPPQSAILGMHKIQNRPIAEGKEIVIRPMMYIAISYDHRIIDGKEAVSFLVRVKECLEDPERMLLSV